MIVVAEGVGQDWLGNTGAERDASGNVKLGDIGTFLRGQIEAYFKAAQIPIVMRYFDPSYHVRSGAANSEDSILCDLFARNAVHAAMAGKTGLVIGFLHDEFIHVPIELLAGRKKSIDPNGPSLEAATLAATGRPKDHDGRRSANTTRSDVGGERVELRLVLPARDRRDVAVVRRRRIS